MKNRFVSAARRFFADQRGATAIEYSLIAGGIAIAIVVVVYAIGARLQVPFATVQTGLK